MNTLTTICVAVLILGLAIMIIGEIKNSPSIKVSGVLWSVLAAAGIAAIMLPAVYDKNKQAEKDLHLATTIVAKLQENSWQQNNQYIENSQEILTIQPELNKFLKNSELNISSFKNKASYTILNLKQNKSIKINLLDGSVSEVECARVSNCPTIKELN